MQYILDNKQSLISLFETESVLKMIFSQQIKNNAVYYCFLKGVVYVIQNVPESYTQYVLKR